MNKKLCMTGCLCPTPFSFIKFIFTQITKAHSVRGVFLHISSYLWKPFVLSHSVVVPLRLSLLSLEKDLGSAWEVCSRQCLPTLHNVLHSIKTEQFSPVYIENQTLCINMSWVLEPAQSICTILQHVYKKQTAYYSSITFIRQCGLKSHYIHHLFMKQPNVNEKIKQ